MSFFEKKTTQFLETHYTFRMKIAAEPTGALALAVALSDEFNALFKKEHFPSVGIIVCGGNLDLSVVPTMLALAGSDK